MCILLAAISSLEWICHLGWFVRAAAVFTHIASAAVTPMTTVKSKMCDNLCWKVRLSLMKLTGFCVEKCGWHISEYISCEIHIFHTIDAPPTLSLSSQTYMSTVILNSCRDIFELQFPGKATLQVLSCSHTWPRLKVSDICHPVPHLVSLKSTIAEMGSDSRSTHSRKSVSVQSDARSNLVLFVWRIKYRTKGNFLIECGF